jgi:hypothetical protein
MGLRERTVHRGIYLNLKKRKLYAGLSRYWLKHQQTRKMSTAFYIATMWNTRNQLVDRHCRYKYVCLGSPVAGVLASTKRQLFRTTCTDQPLPLKTRERCECFTPPVCSHTSDVWAEGILQNCIERTKDPDDRKGPNEYSRPHLSKQEGVQVLRRALRKCT